MRRDNKHISVHHIGGRSGSRAFPVLKKFEEDIINVIYDADPDCLAQIREKNQNLGSELHVLPYCMAGACKSIDFNINYDPYTSSLYDPNPDYNSYYFFNHDHDYVFSEVTRMMEKRHVEAVSIDNIFQSTHTPVPAPDFLSIDTQGAEYDILLGAKETLKSTILALEVEVAFHPIYKDQLLSGQGFNFVGFCALQEMSPFRAPIGLRGQGFQISADAFFLRSIDNIDGNQDKFRRYLMLRKLAFIASVFNQFEYGLECLRRSNEPVGNHSTMQEEPVYLRFLRDIEQNVERMPAAYPPTFASKYSSFEASKSRFKNATAIAAGAEKKTRLTHRIKKLLKHIPMLYLLLKGIKWILYYRAVFFVKRILTGHTGVEAVFLEYGLKDQAKVLRKNRIMQRQYGRDCSDMAGR